MDLLLVGTVGAHVLDVLQVDGHRFRTLASPGEAELAQRTGRADAVICANDVAEIRRRLPAVPVAAYLPTPSTELAADAFESGVDEVFHSGMGTREVRARLAALTRRTPTTTEAFSAGPLRVDLDRGDVTWHERRVPLTARERGVLYELARAEGATVRREAIYRAVWGYAMTRGDRTVDVNVKRLRDKLGAEVGEVLAIETQPGVGYRLMIAPSARAVTEL